MLQRWQNMLEWLSIALILLLPLHQFYYHPGELPNAAILLYLLHSITVAASLQLKRYCPPVPAIQGFAWLEQFLLLALLITLLYYWYLPLAPFSAPPLQWLWLGCQLSSAGLIFRLHLTLKRRNVTNTVNTDSPEPAQSWLVAYASQSGMALQLARCSAQQLQQAGFNVLLTELNQLSRQRLEQFQKALFIVSTYGEGEPPDNGRQFYQLAQQWQHNLQQLEYAVLALGDRSYRQFCAFGHWLQHWLHSRNATALQPLLELDSAQQDSNSLQQWQQLISGVSDSKAVLDEPDWLQLPLLSRYVANPGSSGLPCYVIKLALPAGQQWQAGDLIEVQPENSKCDVALWLTRQQLHGCQAVRYQGRHVPLCWALAELQLDKVQRPAADEPLDTWLSNQPRLPLRSYSIASTPDEGCLMLLVRQVLRPDGSLGKGSGWLTAWAMEQQPVRLRLRPHHQFHLPDTHRPLIFIANGTGIAGIRSLLAQRVKLGQRQNWLLFGERRQQSDFFFARDIQQWQQQGFITHCYLAFSQQGAQKCYVQHLLAEQQQRLLQWLAQGAAIYVCGSRLGMGQAVHQSLLAAVGEDGLNLLQQQGRYRRDLY